MREGAYGPGIFAAGAANSALQRYQGQAGTPEPMLRLAAALAAIQVRAYEMLGPREAAAEDAGSLEPPAGWIEQVVDGVIAAVAEHSPKGGSGLRSLAGRMTAAPVELVVKAARGDADALQEMAGEGVVDPAVVLFVVGATLQPYLAWRLASDPGLAEAGAFPARQDCPACGGKPMMGKHVEPDGHRFLRCGVCGHEWAYPRLACAACGQDDHSKVETLYTGDDQARRVYLCQTCRRYIKISDERLLGGTIYLPLEDIATLHLDLLARERGYSPIGEQSG